MFATTGDEERTEALFGAVFFQTRPTAEGNVQATMGLENLAVLGAVYAAVLVFCLLVTLFVGRLKAYRSRMIGGVGMPDSSARSNH